MKKLSYVSLVLALSFAVTGMASANEESVAQNPYDPTVVPAKKRIEEVRNTVKEVQQKTDAVKREVKELRATTTEARKKAAERLTEAKKKTVLEHGKKFLRQLGERAKRQGKLLNDLADRIEGRIEKFEDGGANMAASKAALETAQGKIRAFISLSETKIKELTAKLETLAASSDPRTALEDFRKELNAAEVAMKESYRAAHQALVDTINSMKGMSSGNRKATTTNATN